MGRLPRRAVFRQRGVQAKVSFSAPMRGHTGGNDAMTPDRLCLHSYWRSSAAYRVRIGLNLKGLPYDIAPVHLVRDGGEQHRPEYAQINPQQLVPVLQHGQRMLRQSLAILEYLDEMWPAPALLPATAILPVSTPSSVAYSATPVSTVIASSRAAGYGCSGANR